MNLCNSTYKDVSRLTHSQAITIVFDLLLLLSYLTLLIPNSLLPLVFLSDLRLRLETIMSKITNMVTKNATMTPPTAPPTTAPSGDDSSGVSGSVVGDIEEVGRGSKYNTCGNYFYKELLCQIYRTSRPEYNML